MMQKLTKTASASLVIAVLYQSSAIANMVDNTKFDFGGYIKADIMFSDYSNGAPDSGSLSRQFYVPGTIYGTPGNGKQVVDFQARETRFNMKSVTNVGGSKLTGFIELDFMTHTDGNERVSNSYSPRIRQAYVSFDNWLFGQTWTTFQNPGALPENLDFVGAADGTPFVRQTLLRYSNNGFQFSIENPETTASSFATGQRIVSGSGSIPDFVGRYNVKFNSGGSMAFAAILRQLNIEQGVLDTQEMGYGISWSGVVPVGDDDFKFTATYGDGLGRYLALNFANAAQLDAQGELETIKSYAGFISYRHWWNEKWRSSITLSGFNADNDQRITAATSNKSSYSGYLNLLYSPSKPLTLGIEYMHAENEKQNGYTGELDRIIFSAKYVL
ncbi:DcaP family trimeric outer membrane transporter [Shewanella marina]|uniref:DcaP family trimeric outer membrane transporter n=1 Tax=Shewanella marina TaxID=487319 RepID=UPI000472C39F